MKLFEVVGKETYKRDLTEDQAIELALAHCKDALKTLDAPIVRGMTEFKNGYGLIQGEAGARRSAHYKLLHDYIGRITATRIPTSIRIDHLCELEKL